PYGLTRQGLIKSGRIRHTKDDRRKLLDRRYFVLGWSNEEKIRVMEQTVTELENALADSQRKKEAIEQAQSEIETQLNLLSVLLSIRDYSRINWRWHAEQIVDLEKERAALLENSGVLAALQAQKEEVILKMEACRQQ